ncbi:MAG: ABC transporter permease [Dehalococcoidia bacterium]|nr:ABC transporter permease [Dehalococcoidia bacterium]
MRSAKAIFVKQLRDTLKNRVMLIQFVLFPAIAFVMTEFVAKPNEEISDVIFITMFAAMFAGMTPLMMPNTIIAEDKEHKSLRFLVMAGVKPFEYLLGIGGFVLVISSFVALAFATMAGFSGPELGQFVLVMILGSAASIILGATIGIFSKNQQSATALGTPIMLLFAFSPMIAMFNERLSQITSFLYTLQVRELILSFDPSSLPSDDSFSYAKPILIILANIVVIAILFVLAYKKKGLRG